MSDDEVIEFKITDYDLENEFVPSRRHRLSKNQQIYGIWAEKEDDDDEEEDRRPGQGRRKDYTTPLNFVSGGVQVAGKQENKQNTADEDEEFSMQVDSDSSEGDDTNLRKQFLQKDARGYGTGELAGFRKRSTRIRDTVLTERGVGSWEKHTKGIGAKLLLQMGYQPGKGLGKDLQGIQAPIEAHLRKGRGAIGAYGPEKKTKESKIQKPSEETTSGVEPKVKKMSQWRKEGASQQKKIRYVYKSIDDVLEESKKPGIRRREISELSNVKVIDMTGPEERVLSGYHAIAGVQKPGDEWEAKEKKLTNFSMPELIHNLNLLLGLAEQGIIDKDQKMKQNEDKITILKNQLKTEYKTLEEELAVLTKLSKVAETVETVIAKSKENALSLEEASEIFLNIKNTMFNEYVSHEIPYLAGELIKPLIFEFLEEWKPLENPVMPVPVFQHWKSILVYDESIPTTPMTPNAYYKLVWDTWVPHMRAATSLWSCREWAPMVELLANWAPLVSNWILDAVLRDLILSKLHKEVNEWNPLTDCVPIHSWIYPWINFLGKHFKSTVYPTIRHKLSMALVSWHPSDCSARLMLQPWMNVFDTGEMELFLVNNILPKLQLTLQEFVINPHQQQLDSWNWVMEWAEMIPPPMMAMMLDKYFFRKWNQVLTMWLNMNPDYDQVSRWYTGWKSVIPSAILAQPIIKDHLRAALETMSRSVGGPASIAVEDQASKQRAENLAEAIRTASKIPEGFKDLVQKRCEERGILWMPVPNRTMEGKQIYRCGRLQVYIDRSVLFVSQEGGSFVPMSLYELLANAA